MAVESESQAQQEKHLCEHAQAEIRELQAQGIQPTLDEIVWINDLSRAVENPKGGEHRHLAGEPSRAGSVWFWPFTIQARIWYESTFGWFDGNAELENNALAYALAHGRESGAFLHLTGYQSAKKAIEQWRAALDCTDEELAAAMFDVIPHDDEIQRLEAKFKEEYNKAHGIEEEQQESIDRQSIVDELMAVTGLPRDVWIRQESESRTLNVLRIIARQQAAMAGIGGDERPDPDDPYMQACKRLGIAIKEIRRRHKEQGESGNGT